MLLQEIPLKSEQSSSAFARKNGVHGNTELTLFPTESAAGFLRTREHGRAVLRTPEPPGSRTMCNNVLTLEALR